MSYSSEHRRLQPVLDKARRLDIATHPAPNALFEALSAGFNLWCTPDDHPDGWDGVKMNAGAFAKPCEYIGTATWGWTDEQITHIDLDTEAYALRDRDKPASHAETAAYHNRPEDVAWAAAKIGWLFSLVRFECLPIKVDDEREMRLPSAVRDEQDYPSTCPWCGSDVDVIEAYYEKQQRYLAFCVNNGSCNFREL